MEETTLKENRAFKLTTPGIENNPPANKVGRSIGKVVESLGNGGLSVSQQVKSPRKCFINKKMRVFVKRWKTSRLS